MRNYLEKYNSELKSSKNITIKRSITEITRLPKKFLLSKSKKIPPITIIIQKQMQSLFARE